MNKAWLKECPSQNHYYAQKYKTCYCSSATEDCECSAEDDWDPTAPHEWGAIDLPATMNTLTLIVSVSEVKDFCCSSGHKYILFCGKDVNWSDYSNLWNQCHHAVHEYDSGEVAILFM
jgi:hypothetical protein